MAVTGTPSMEAYNLIIGSEQLREMFGNVPDTATYEEFRVYIDTLDTLTVLSQDQTQDEWHLATDWIEEFYGKLYYYNQEQPFDAGFRNLVKLDALNIIVSSSNMSVFTFPSLTHVRSLSAGGERAYDYLELLPSITHITNWTNKGTGASLGLNAINALNVKEAFEDVTFGKIGSSDSTSFSLKTSSEPDEDYSFLTSFFEQNPRLAYITIVGIDSIDFLSPLLSAFELTLTDVGNLNGIDRPNFELESWGDSIIKIKDESFESLSFDALGCALNPDRASKFREALEDSHPFYVSLWDVAYPDGKDCGDSDSTPDSFSFDSSTNVDEGSEQTSNTITLDGFDGSLKVVVSGAPSYQVKKNDGSFTSGDVYVSEGDTIQVKVDAPDDLDSAYNVKVLVGYTSAVWLISTGANAGPTVVNPVPDYIYSSDDKNVSIDFSDTFVDSDGHDLEYHVVGLPKGLYIEGTKIVGDIDLGAYGRYTVYLQATDELGAKVNDIFQIAVYGRIDEEIGAEDIVKNRSDVKLAGAIANAAFHSAGEAKETAFDNYVNKADKTDVEDSLNDAGVKIGTNEACITTLKNQVLALQNALKLVEDQVDDLELDFDALEAEVDAIDVNAVVVETPVEDEEDEVVVVNAGTWSGVISGDNAQLLTAVKAGPVMRYFLNVTKESSETFLSAVAMEAVLTASPGENDVTVSSITEKQDGTGAQMVVDASLAGLTPQQVTLTIGSLIA